MGCKATFKHCNSNTVCHASKKWAYLHYKRWSNGAGVATAIKQFFIFNGCFFKILLITWCRDKCTDMFVVLLTNSVLTTSSTSSDPMKWNSTLYITVSDDLIRLLFSSTVILKPKYCYTNDLRRFVCKIVFYKTRRNGQLLPSCQAIITMMSLLFYLLFFYVF